MMTTKRGVQLTLMPSVALGNLHPAVGAIRRMSANANARPGDVTGICCVVLHATADEGREVGAIEWLCDARSSASAHLVIRRDGVAIRVVEDYRRAWHAGVSEWNTFTDVNDFSLGWEICNRNDGREPYTDSQYTTLAQLGSWYVRQGVPLGAFVSHAEIAVPRGRKSDPRGFDWERFRAGVRAELERRNTMGV